MTGQVFVDEFVYGGKEDLKQGRSKGSKKKEDSCGSREVDKKRGVKRTYFKRIENYSSKELNKIFISYISGKAKINNR